MIQDFLPLAKRVVYKAAKVALYTRQVLARPYIVAMIGTAGAGKSTLSKGLSNVVGAEDQFVYLGENSKKIQFNSALVEWAKNRQADRLGQLIFFLLMPFEMWSRYIPARFSRRGILLMDRYPFLRTGNGPHVTWYNFAVRFLLPRPSLIVHLGGDLESIWKRKQKADLPTAGKERGKCMALLESGVAKRNLMVDVIEQTPEEALNEICNALVDDPALHRSLRNKSGKVVFGCVHWSGPQFHYKFFLTKKAKTEGARALEAMAKAKQTGLAPFVPEFESKGKGSLLEVVRYAPLGSDVSTSDLTNFIATGMGLGHGESSLWDILSLTVLDKHYGDLAAYTACRSVLKQARCSLSFAHRDFHLGNLFADANGSMKVIDWGTARFDSHSLFDVLQMSVYAIGKQNGLKWHEAVYFLEKENPLEGLQIQSVVACWERFASELTPQVRAAFLLDSISLPLQRCSRMEQEDVRDKYVEVVELAAKLCGNGEAS